MRHEVRSLVSLGPLPSSQGATAEQVQVFERALASISAPVSDIEARNLVRLFGPDDCFGLAWTLLHLIESAPGWPMQDVLRGVGGNEWAERLRERSTVGGAPHAA